MNGKKRNGGSAAPPRTPASARTSRPTRTPAANRCVLAAVFLLLLFPAAWGCRSLQPFDVRTRVMLDPQPVSDIEPITEMPLRGRACGPRVAVIDVDGLLVNENQTGLMSLGANPMDLFRAKLDYAARRPEIVAVVLRIHSPGGSVTASDIMHRDLQRFREATGRPVVACLMDVAAGGAYYLATACDAIIAHPTTVTGGFGVILNLYNLEDMLAQFNIIGVSVKSGRHVDIGSPLRMIPPESRELLQSMADGFQQRFRQSIIAARSPTLADDEELWDGRILTAGEAQLRGLIDAVGYLDDAIVMAAAGGGTDNVVMLRPSRDRARSIYSVTPNRPIQQDLLPIDVPGLNREKLPTFLFMWQPDPSLH